ncbi:MAG TPA: MFS transporter, partial [Porticoccaceae bacterium]
MLRATLLSVSLLTVFASAAIAPALSEIAAAFPGVSETRIKSLLTAPALTMMVVSPMMGWLSHLLGTKRLLFVGLFFYLVGGVGGGLAGTFEQLFSMRLLLGVGVGILMPMSSALMAQFFEGRERLRMMGLSSSVTSLFGVVANVMVGYLALVSWRYGFAVYSLGLLVLVLVVRYLPTMPGAGTVKGLRFRLPASAVWWALAIFMLMLAIYAVMVNVSLFITGEGIGGPRETGIAISCLTFASFFTGILNARVKALLGRYFVLVNLTLVAMGYCWLTLSGSLSDVIVSLLLIGFGNGFLMPYLFYRATTSVPANMVMGAMGLMSLAISLGQFTTPLILDGIGVLLGDTSIRFIFQFTGVAVALAACSQIVWIVGLRRRP